MKDRSKKLTINPAVSEAQRKFLYATKGAGWVKEHGFDNKGELPEKVKPVSKSQGERPVKNSLRARRKATCNRRKAPSALKMDPSRTITLRRHFCNLLTRKFAELKGRIVKFVGEEDAFSLTENDSLRGRVRRAIKEIGELEGAMPGYGQVYLNGSHVWYEGGDGDEREFYKAVESILKAVPGITKVSYEAEARPKGGGWLLLNANPSQMIGVNSNPHHDEHGRFASADGGIIAAIAKHASSLGAHLGHLEHAFAEHVKAEFDFAIQGESERTKAVVGAVIKVAKVGMAAAFATYTAGQAMAERVSRERGHTEEQARALRGTLSTLDLVAAKPMVAMSAPLSFLPAASMGYLAYSTARDPMATIRAAGKVVREAFHHVKEATRAPGHTANAEADVAGWVASALERHGFSDWHRALLAAAMDETDSVLDGVRLADSLMAQHPVENALLGSSPQKVKAFQRWLAQQFQETLTGHTEEELWRLYAERGFKRGAARAFDDSRRSKRGSMKPDFYEGTKDEFLRSSFAQPVSQERMEMLAGRSFDDLENVTSDMSTRMSRTLMDGLVQGKGPRELARDLNREVDVGRDRALTIARTEVIRAHAEGQLTALENMGVEEVGVAVEWATSGFNVCEKCADLEGVTFKIKEAHGLIPRHPNCRCAFLPADQADLTPGHKEIAEETRGDIVVGNAVFPPVGWVRPTWEEASEEEMFRTIDPLDKLSDVVNMFCKTGKGGGVQVDPDSIHEI